MDKVKSSVAVAKATEMSTLFYGTLHHSSYQLPASLSLVFSAVKCNLHFSIDLVPPGSSKELCSHHYFYPHKICHNNGIPNNNNKYHK